MEIENKICRFCLKIVYDNTFSAIDAVTRRLLLMFRLHLDIDISKNPVMCRECATGLKNLFHFKTMLERVRKISFIESGYIDKSKKLCEFCMKPTGWESYTFRDKTKKSIIVVIQRHILEQLFQKLKDADKLVICKNCLCLLDSFLRFLRHSLGVEERIKRYIETVQGLSSCQVELSNVRNFLLLEVARKNKFNCSDATEVQEQEVSCDEDRGVEFHSFNQNGARPDVSESNCHKDKGLEPQKNNNFDQLCNTALDIRKDVREREKGEKNSEVRENKFHNFNEMNRIGLITAKNKSFYHEESILENDYHGQREEKSQVNENTVELSGAWFHVVNYTAGYGWNGGHKPQIYNNLVELENAMLDIKTYENSELHLMENRFNCSEESRIECSHEENGEDRPQINESFSQLNNPKSPKLDIKSYKNSELDLIENKFGCSEGPKIESSYDRNVASKPHINESINKLDSLSSPNLDSKNYENSEEDVLEDKFECREGSKIESSCDESREDKPQIDESLGRFGSPDNLNLGIKNYENSEPDLIEDNFVSSGTTKLKSTCDEKKSDKPQTTENFGKLGSLKLGIKDNETEINSQSNHCESSPYAAALLKSISEIENPSLFFCENFEETSTSKGKLPLYQNEYEKYLQNARGINLGLPLYRCGVCPYQTIHENNLESHMLYHLVNTRTIIYRCGLCGFETVLESTLKRHLIAHSDIDVNPLNETIHIHIGIYEKLHGSSFNEGCENPAKLTVYTCQNCSYQTHCKNLIHSHQSTFCKFVTHKIETSHCFKGAKISIDILENEFICNGGTNMETSCSESARTVGLESDILLAKLLRNDECKIENSCVVNKENAVKSHKNFVDTDAQENKVKQYAGSCQSFQVATHSLDSVTENEHCSSPSKSSQDESTLGRILPALLDRTTENCVDVTTYTCKICLGKNPYEKMIYNYALESHVIRIFKCDKCLYEGGSMYGLTRHMRIHRKPSEVRMRRSEKKFESKFKRNVQQLHVPQSERNMCK